MLRMSWSSNMLVKQLLFLLATVASSTTIYVSAKPVKQIPFAGLGESSANATKVDVELYVMSKCPDAVSIETNVGLHADSVETMRDDYG